MKYLFALALPLAVMACGDSATTETVDDSTVETTTPGAATNSMPEEPAPMEAPADDAGMTSANETLDAVRNAGGLTNLPPETAVGNIDAWISKLEGTPGTETIVSNLQELKTELSNPTIDGAAVGNLLTELGSETEAAGADNPAVTSLGQALSQAGSQLKG